MHGSRACVALRAYMPSETTKQIARSDCRTCYRCAGGPRAALHQSIPAAGRGWRPHRAGQLCVCRRGRAAQLPPGDDDGWCGTSQWGSGFGTARGRKRAAAGRGASRALSPHRPPGPLVHADASAVRIGAANPDGLLPVRQRGACSRVGSQFVLQARARPPVTALTTCTLAAPPTHAAPPPPWMRAWRGGGGGGWGRVDVCEQGMPPAASAPAHARLHRVRRYRCCRVHATPRSGARAPTHTRVHAASLCVRSPSLNGASGRHAGAQLGD